MTVDLFKQKYGHEIEGMWMPRVTAITSFVANTNGFWPREGKDWGSLVHEAVATFLQGTREQPLQVLPSLNAFVAWQKEYCFEVLNPAENVERLVVDVQNLYTGTIDMVGSLQGVFGLLDLKTGSSIREEYALQTAAYVNAYNTSAEKIHRCRARWILRIDQYAKCQGCFAKQRERDKTGVIREGNPLCNHVWESQKGEVEFKELQDYEHDLQAFLCAKEVWEWYHKDWLKRVPNYPRKIIQKVLI